MKETPKNAEHEAVQEERSKKLNEGVRNLTKEIINNAFPENHITPEDNITIFNMVRTSEGKMGILITKPSKDEARGGDEGEENKVTLLIGSVEKNNTPLIDRLKFGYLWARVGEGRSRKGRWWRNLHSTMYTDKRIATQFTLEELTSAEPVAHAKEGAETLGPPQLFEGETILNAIQRGNRSGYLNSLILDRWKE